MKTLIIVNPNSGKRMLLNFFLPQVQRILEKNQIRCEVRTTRYSGHAAVLSRQYSTEMDFITVFGGDGTIREVVKGMGEHPVPLGIVPFGTVNVLALDLGISFNPILAATNITKGFVRFIDVGYVNEEPFLLMLSTGIDALAIHNVDLRAKKYLGRMAYVFSALWSAATQRLRQVRIHIEDQDIHDRGYLLIISNSRLYGGPFEIDDKARIDDGILNVLLFKKRSRVDLFRLLMGVLVHRLKRMRDVAAYEGRVIRLSARTRIKMQMDGDKAPSTPARVWIKERVLPVFVPENQTQEPLEAVKTVLSTMFTR